jgi:protein subunit release factor A
MTTLYIEIRAAEGGDDAKLLVEDQLSIYLNYISNRGCL